jgi:hypothetical protein
MYNHAIVCQASVVNAIECKWTIIHVILEFEFVGGWLEYYGEMIVSKHLLQDCYS